MDSEPPASAASSAPSAPSSPPAPTVVPASPSPDLPPPPLAPVATTRAWLPALQSLRGLAAVWVVLYHLQVYLRFLGQPLLPIPGLRFGWLGVDLFFVLSAYLLGQPYIDGRSPRWTRFVSDRFLRIAPPYYASFALTALGYAVFAPAVWLPSQAWASLVFLNVFDRLWFIAINPAFWSLAVEMQFYLLLPFLAPLFRSRRWPLALAGCVAIAVGYRALLFGMWNGDETHWTLQLETFTLPSFLGHFGLGLAIARIRLLSQPIGSGARRLTFALGALLVLLPTWAWIPGGDTVRFSGFSWEADVLLRLLAAGGFALIVLATASGGWVARALGWRPLEWLGAISYSLYLMHIPVQVLMLQVVDATQDRLGWAALAFAASVLAGWLLYRLVEAPAEVWRRKRKLRQKQRAALAATS